MVLSALSKREKILQNTDLIYCAYTKCTQYSLLIDVHKFHIHRVDRGEHISGTLNHALSCLRHGNRGARGQEHGLVAATKWQEGQVVTLH
jgi:hypothetical protein